MITNVMVTIVLITAQASTGETVYETPWHSMEDCIEHSFMLNTMQEGDAVRRSGLYTTEYNSNLTHYCVEARHDYE